jgi:hypothetical protein
MTATPPFTAPDGSPLTWHCHRCQRVLGEVAGPSDLRDADGRVFSAGKRGLVVICPCGYRNRFFRATPLDKRAGPDSR